jgi:hypothetical protein
VTTSKEHGRRHLRREVEGTRNSPQKKISLDGKARALFPQLPSPDAS